MPRRSTPASDADAVPPALHELELEVMEQLWRGGEATVRSVMNELNGDTTRDRAYTTYMTTMARLHKKGLLRRRREGKTDLYSPAHSRDEYTAMRARAEVNEVISRYGDAALSHFAEQMAELDPERRRALQRLARGR